MKYSEILELNKYFQPVYDLENEIEAYWKQFIPNERFYKVLSELLNSLEGNTPEERKSIWLQGTYGTGKSHATAVIKHILFDDLEAINDFIENLNEQTKFKIKHFRKDKKVFPVVLKGTSSIIDNRTFALVLEKSVKNSLRKEGITTPITKTDFEIMIEKLKSNEINWENIFRGSEVEIYGTTEEIVSKLRSGNIDLMTKIEKILSQRGIHFSTENIADWLVDVRNELKNRGIADYLVIYWDEFTGVLELPKSGLLLTELQNISELSKAGKGVYLFVISHRRPYQTGISGDDVAKVFDRFKVLNYSMEPLTTYHIINAAIKKKNSTKFTELKNKYIGSVRSIIDIILGNEGSKIKRVLEDLFPIHPYTAYLATFMARNIGSTERSIFKFLYDEKNGFKKFIKENPGRRGKIFLTADYLWDFFYNEFERIEDEKFYPALEKFKLYNTDLEKKGEQYLAVFKGVLLLNILYRFVEAEESSLVAPTEENIINLFAGVINQKDLIKILSYIDDKQIIDRTPDNLYLITSSGLPSKEVELEKSKLRIEYDTVERILNEDQKNELKNIVSNTVCRPVELEIIDASSNEYLLRSKLKKAFKKEYTIHLCLILGKNEQELQQIKKILSKLSSEEDFKNIIFIVSERYLDDKTFNKFLEYKARSKVADKHNYSEDRNVNEENSRKIIDSWIKSIKSGYLEWFLQDKNGKELMRDFDKKIDEELSGRIFFYGPENISGTRKNRNIWKIMKTRGTKSAEIFLFARDRKDLEEKTSNGLQSYLRSILMDENGEYIVDINLKLKEEGVSGDHPLKKMYLEVKKTFEKAKNKSRFNLSEELIFLTKPPYGLYNSMLGQAIISFLMRDYTGKLFEVGTGIPITADIMRDKIYYLFESWNKSVPKENLAVRFGTEDEEQLIEILKDMFKLGNVKSLNDVRWKIREWIKKQGFPIWVFKYAENINENSKEAIDSIFELVKSLDMEITYEKTKEYLTTIERVKYDLEMLISQENPRKLFENWLENCLESISDEKIESSAENIENVIDYLKELSAENIENVIDYLKKTMQEEIASWTEDKVREKLMQWYVLQVNINRTPEDESKNSSTAVTTTQSNALLDIQHIEPHAVLTEERVESIKKLVWKSPEKSVKELLIKIINELKDRCPDIVELIEKSLEDAL